LLLEARGVDVGVPGRTLVAHLDLALEPGHFVAVLGCNGCGKTLTLLTLAGLRPPVAGAVSLGGQSIESIGAAARARASALLPQDSEMWGTATVFETVMVGRFAHGPAWGKNSADDATIVSEAIGRTGLVTLKQRATSTLSGGEQRRVAIASVLAQRAPVALLDEPTNHLDPQHAVAMLSLFAQHAAAGGAVVATLHDATLAARFASHVLLLFGDGRWEFGGIDALLSAGKLSQLYGTPIVEARAGERRLFAAA
jgi:iron complex transport system ATP-binding protein